MSDVKARISIEISSTAEPERTQRAIERLAEQIQRSMNAPADDSLTAGDVIAIQRGPAPVLVAQIAALMLPERAKENPTGEQVTRALDSADELIRFAGARHLVAELEQSSDLRAPYWTAAELMEKLATAAVSAWTGDPEHELAWRNDYRAAALDRMGALLAASGLKLVRR